MIAVSGASQCLLAWGLARLSTFCRQLMDPKTEVSALRREQLGRLRDARRLACRLGHQSHRFWPLVEPEQISDSPALAICLNCGIVRSLKAVLG